MSGQLPENRIIIDLHEKFIQRNPLYRGEAVNPDVFYGYLRILLACDAAHDFTGSRSSDLVNPGSMSNSPVSNSQSGTKTDAPKSAIKKKSPVPKTKTFSVIENHRRYIAGLLTADILRDSVLLNGVRLEGYEAFNILKKVIENIIINSPDGLQKNREIIQLLKTDRSISNPGNYLSVFLSTDAVAKLTIGSILKTLGIETVIAADFYTEAKRFSCDSNYNTVELIETLHKYSTNKSIKGKSDTIYMTIDQSSDKTNLIPFYSSMIEQILPRPAGCPKKKTLLSVYDLTQKYDASNDDSLQVTLKGLNLLITRDNPIDFKISCGTNIVFNGNMNQDTSGVVNLTISNYFNRPISNFSLNNNKDYITKQTNNSVSGITRQILANKNSGVSNADMINTNLIAGKTAGDFLQIMSFLKNADERQDGPGRNALYLSFDISSAEIAGIFHPNVILENSFASSKRYEGVTKGLKIFVDAQTAIENRVQPEQILLNISNTSKKRRGNTDIEAANSLISMQSDFGKKTNKISSMSNEQLKTKLKSVGINVTKISSRGKRLNLTRKEMEKKALLFKNLQLRAKKMGIKIMYKSRTRGYIYKTYTRLMNELEKLKQMKNSMKFG